jgi:hypothetical protein
MWRLACTSLALAAHSETEFEKRFHHAQEAYNRGCIQTPGAKQDAELQQDALNQLHGSLELAPEDHPWRAHNLFYLGNCYEQTPHALTKGRQYYGDLVEFLADADKSNQQVKQLLLVTHSNMARLYVMQQSLTRMTDWNMMVMHAKKAYDLSPEDEAAQLQYSLALIMANKTPKKAIQILKKAEKAGALRTPSEFVRIGQALANCSTPSSSYWKLAKKYMEKGRKKFPTSAYLSYQLGRMGQLLGDDFDKLAGNVVLPNLRDAQELAIREFRQTMQRASKVMPPSTSIQCSPTDGSNAHLDWSTGSSKFEWIGEPSAPYGQDQPLLWEHRPAKDFTSSWGSLRYEEERRSFHATMNDMWVLGTDGILLDRQCQFYALSHDEEIQWFKLPKAVQTLVRPEPVVLAKAISLIQLWGSQVYHFSVEAMSRLHLLRSVWENDPTVKIIVPAKGDGELKAFMFVWLELMQVPAEQLWAYPQVEQAAVFVQELHMADWRTIEQGGSTSSNSGASSSSKGVQMLRDSGRLLHYLPPKPLIQDLATFAKRECTEPQPVVLFVSRGGSNTRQFSNEAALKLSIANLLKVEAPKFKLTVFGDNPVPPMQETKALFAAAKVVIGVHGAGMGNLIFCAPGTHVVELAVRQPHGHYFAHLSVALDLQYWWVPLIGASAHFNHFITWEKKELLGILSQILKAEVSTGGKAGVEGGRKKVVGDNGGEGTGGGNKGGRGGHGKGATATAGKGETKQKKKTKKMAEEMVKEAK